MAPAVVSMRLLAVMMTVVVAVVMAAPPPSSGGPQVAMFCGKLNMHLDLRTGVWEPDPSGTTSCLSSSHDILQYCQQVYPDVRVTGVEEATQAVSVDNWCRRGKTRCHGNSHIVLPYHCLEAVQQEVDVDEVDVQEVDVEEAGVADGDSDRSSLGDCVQMGQMKLDECHPARFWKRLARQMCLEYTLWDYTPRRPCGTDGFRGIRYTCCPSPAGDSGETSPREISSYDDYDGGYRGDDDDDEEEEVAEEEEEEDDDEEEEEVEVPEVEEDEDVADDDDEEEEVDAREEEFAQDEVDDEEEEMEQQQQEEQQQQQQEEEEEEGSDLRNDEDEEAGDKPRSSSSSRSSSRSPYEDDLQLWFDMNDAQSSEEADTEAAAPVGEDQADEDYPAVMVDGGEEEEEVEEEEADYETREGSDSGADDYNVEYDWPSAPGHSDYGEEAGETGADDESDEQQEQEQQEQQEQQDVVKLYFDSPAGDELEHDRFLKAKEQLEVHHHLRLIQIMKAWEEAKINAENRPNSDRQAAALIKRFQRLVNQLDTALAGAKQRLSDTHQSRVEAALSMQRRSALEDYLSQLQAQPPKRERLLQALKRYVWTEQRDQVHSVRHFQHEQRSSDPPPPPTALLMVQAHLTVIKKRLNESLSLLSHVPKLGPGIQAQISGLASYVQSYGQGLLNVGQSSGQGLLNVGQSYGSDGLVPPSDTPPVLWPERARGGPPGESDESGAATNEDLASDLFQMDARKAEQFNVWAVIALLVGIVVVTTVVVGSLVLLRRKAYRPVSTSEVDEELSHEERHLSKMQQNGYENPTYKLYEALQH